MDLCLLIFIYWIILLLQILSIKPLNTDPCDIIRNELKLVDIPTLRILKRQIKSPRSSLYVTITIAYQSQMPVEVRWYRPATNHNLNNSEIPNMLPVLGQDIYHSYQLRSHDVYASHLVIKKQLGKIPASYTAVLMVNNSLQYQVQTDITPSQVFHRERLYLPDGIRMYVHKTKKNQPAFVQCVANIPKYVTNPNYEMEMVHQKLIERKTKSSKYKVFSRELGKISDTILGLKYNTLGNSVNAMRSVEGLGLEYKIEACLPFVTTRDLGHYKCSFKGTKTELTADHILKLDDDFHSFKPVVQFEPCDYSSISGFKRGYNIYKKNIHIILSSAHETCLRCRAAGPPNTTVAIRAIKRGPGHRDRPGADLDTYPNVTKVTYTDISDIRDSAVTYILHNPSTQHAGSYLCYAEYDMEYFSSQKFTVNVVTKYNFI